ncbi:MAG: DUF6119 family protein [Oligoflexus sp.]
MPQDTITIYLFKESVTSFNELIELDDSYTNPSLDSNAPIRKYVTLTPLTLFDAEAEAKILWTDKTPDWSGLVSKFVEEDTVQRFRNKSHSAVLLIKTSSRFFALTFGHYGRRAIKTDLVVKRFGLLVALNTINPYEVKFADAISAAELQIRTTKTASRHTNINNLGLALYDNDDLLAITGRPIPDESTFASSITGADALRLKLDISRESLVTTLQEAIRLYKLERYKDSFSFYEKLEFVTDGAILETLKNRFCGMVKDQGFKAFSIGIFSIEDSESVASFFIEFNEEKYECDDIDFDSLDDVVTNKLNNQYQHLLECKVHAVGLNEEIQKTFPFIDCISAEIVDEDETYVLLMGRWRKVAKDYIQRVNEKIDSIPSIELDLPPFNKSKNGSDTAIKGGQRILSENAYNERISGIPELELKLMDCNNIIVDGDPIEPCDLITKDRKMIHVKRNTKSAQLSHLFRQAYNSIEAFLREPSFRRGGW